MSSLKELIDKQHLKDLIEKQLGRVDGLMLSEDGKTAFLTVPRENITESTKALVWLNAVIEVLEKRPDSDPETIKTLRGMQVVFTDCALMAKHYLGYRDETANAQYRKYDLMIRFTLDPKHDDRIMMEVGAAVPRNRTAPPARSLEDLDDEED